MTNSLPTGHILQNEYKIEKILGAGGFGITYLARDTNLNYLVVIKEFLPQDMAARDQSRINVTPFTKDTQSYNHLLKRFSEEAQLLAKMRHPNIVKVTRFFKANNTAYFVMEYAEGETLKEYLQRNKTMSEEEMLSVMMPILEGAKYVHEQGFLHRDIAPDNIYLTKNGMPILIDFGAARDAIAEESKNISSIVKEGYSSPEQYTINNKQNASSDIYALGAVFYRMMTGKVPTNAPHRQTALLNDDVDPIGDITKEYEGKYTPQFLHAIKKALNIRATDRFPSVSNFQKALTGESIVDSSPSSTSRHISSTTEQNSSLNTNKSNSTGLIIAFVVVLLLLLGGIGYVYMGQDTVPTPQSQTTARTTISTPVDTEDDELETAKKELAKVTRQKEEAQKQHEAEIERQKQETEALKLKAEQDKAKRKQSSGNLSDLLKQAKAYYFGSSTVGQDYYKAKEYFLKAANLYSIDAYRYLGTIYLFGHGAVIDKKEAKKWLQMGIDAGDLKAKELYDKYISSSVVTQPAQPGYTTNKKLYKVINVAKWDTLNVRTNPYATSSNKIGELASNARNIHIVGDTTNHKGTKWSKIEYNVNGYPVQGWVVSRCLASQNAASRHRPNNTVYKVVKIPSNDTLSVRSGLGTQYAKIGDLPYYARNIHIIKCGYSNKGGKWCQVQYGTTKGWVSAKYLRKQ